MSIRKSNGEVEYELTDADLARIESFELVDGGTSPERALEQQQLCVMQLVSVLTHQQDITPTSPTLSDDPPCVSETIAHFMIRVNDDPRTTDEQRQELKELVPLVIGTCPVVPNRWFGEIRCRTTEYQKLEQARRAVLQADDRLTPFEQRVALVKRAATITADEADEIVANLDA